MSQYIFWGSYIYIPFAVICVLAIRKHTGALRAIAALALAASSVLAYARFVEPRILNVERTSIILPGASEDAPSIRIALVSDMHYGVFANAMPMRRIVRKVAAQKPDALFIAGDFVYKIAPEDIDRALAPLADLDMPIFAVLGNHDIGMPGSDFSGELYSAIRKLDISMIENRALEVALGGQEVIVGGASNVWFNRNNFPDEPNLPDKPFILLTHGPDDALIAPENLDYDIMLSGHTHGGQIRIPGLVERIIPTQYPFDKGLHIYPSETGPRHIYVTPGTGMVLLPMRFNMPPRIDVLTLHLPPTP